jgi:hypothetical protein
MKLELTDNLLNLNNNQLKKLAAKTVNFMYTFRHNSSARRLLIEVLNTSIERNYITNYKEVMQDGWEE